MWQQWKAVTSVWKAAAAKAAAMNTAGSTEPAVGAVEATAAASEMEAATTIQAADEAAEDGDWLEVLAAVAMAEATADSRSVAGAVRAENPLFQPMGAEAATREGAAVAKKAATVVEAATELEGAAKAAAVVDAATMVEAVATAMVLGEVSAATMAVREAIVAARAAVESVEWDTEYEEAATKAIEEAVLAEATQGDTEGGGGASGEESRAENRTFDPGKFQYSTL